MLKLTLRLVRLLSNKSNQEPSSNTQISHTEKLTILTKISQKINIGLKPSILMLDQDSIKKKLSHEEKIELGLFIPKSPFNSRLSKSTEKDYLTKITNELYQHQKINLQTYIKILQNNLFLQQSQMNLNQYINVIYKDIYARYLISKSIGVQWQGFYADTGVMNEQSTHNYNRQASHQQHYSVLLDFIQNNAHLIRKEQTIGLYSFYQHKFVHESQVGVQKVKRLGYYVKEQLTSFAKYQNQFSVLQEKNSKVYMLFMVDRLEKLINPNAICINPQDKYIMLKKHSPQQNITTQYLIVSLETYKQHEKYFKSNQYQRHNTFDAKYLLGMQCMSIPIVSQISGYMRAPNPYIVNSNCHISDFQRVKVHKLSHRPPPICSQGQIQLNANNNKYSLTMHMMDPLKFTKKLQFIQQGVKFMDFYDVLDDQLYFCQSTKQVLSWRIGEKYSIQIPQQNANMILKGFEKQKTVISQSKIKIQNLNTGIKPKERRRFRKQRKQKLRQITEHLPLQSSLFEITSLTLSSLSQTLFTIPLFIKNQQVTPYEKILTQQEIDLLLQHKINQINMQQKRQKGFECVYIFANEQLLKALLYLKNLSKSKDIHNVIIEPQEQTQQLIPTALHLNYLINKSKGRGRKIASQVKNNINLIKLHPTLSDQSKNIPIIDLIQGIVKSNSRRQYGLGFEALRLWTASNDSYLGDRSIKDQDINKQLQHSQLIRTIYWNLLSIVPIREIKQVEPQLYLSKFILDLIDSFIANVQECYRQMNLHQAYLLINDFYSNIIGEIYVKAVRPRIIAYPNLKENQEHFFVIRRILELVPVISPLFPFTSYHISRKSVLQWPQITNKKFYQRLPLHNEMIETRVKLINKLRLNQLDHAQIYCESLKEEFSAHDLELFFNVDSVTFTKPDLQYRACSVELKKNNPLTSEQKLTIYLSEQHCLRCDDKSKQTEHLCKHCVSYLQEQIAEPLTYFPQARVSKLL